MSRIDRRIYLVSRSPRRRELLKQIGVHFEVLMLRTTPEERADVDEQVLAGEVPADYVMRVARIKAEFGWRRVVDRHLPALAVLGADTTVALGDEIFGKPDDAEHACAILERLSGQEHCVYTAIALAFEQRVEAALSCTRVKFRKLDSAEIRRYAATGEPMDKAGAYAIQGKAACFVSELNGSYSGVMGLPLFETAQLLNRFGYLLP